MIKISVGVMAYNEEGIIGEQLSSLLAQKLVSAELTEILAVCSGCTDQTEAIVRGYASKDGRVRLLSQPKRKGKASAINLFLKEAKGEVAVIAGGDTKLAEGSLEALLAPFKDKKTGMTGGHPVPVNERDTLLGFAVHLLWNLHHELALQHPKLGELIAFRMVIDAIPAETAVDELSIEAKIKDKGLDLCYCPDAVVYNRGPLTVNDFLKQRRRIYCGHLWVKKTAGYEASSMGTGRIATLLFKNLKPGVKELFYTAGAVGLEALGRFLGAWDFYIRKKNPVVWESIRSTKRL